MVFLGQAKLRALHRSPFFAEELERLVFILRSKDRNGFEGIPCNWNYLVPQMPKKIALNKDEDARVKELKNQATIHKYSCLDAVMVEMKWWMMRLIAHEDYEL